LSGGERFARSLAINFGGLVCRANRAGKTHLSYLVSRDFIWRATRAEPSRAEPSRACDSGRRQRHLAATSR